MSGLLIGFAVVFFVLVACLGWVLYELAHAPLVDADGNIIEEPS